MINLQQFLPVPPKPGADGQRIFVSIAVSLVLHGALLSAPLYGDRHLGRPWAPPQLTAILPSLTVTFREDAAAGAVITVRQDQVSAPPDVTAALAPPLAGTLSSPEPAEAARPQPRSGLGIIAEHYRRPSELTEPPYPLTVGSLDFRDDEIGTTSGRYLVEIYINERGGVDGAEILSGSPPPALSERARIVFGETQYKPGIWRGKSVKSRLLVELFLPPKPRDVSPGQ